MRANRLLTSVLLMLAAGCGRTEPVRDDQGVTQGNKTYSLDFTSLTLNPGKGKVVGCYSKEAGSESNIALKCTWTSSAPNVAFVQPNQGQGAVYIGVEPLTPGKATFTAVFPEGGITRTMEVTVIPFVLEVTPSVVAKPVGSTQVYKMRFIDKDGEVNFVTDQTAVRWSVSPGSLARIVSVTAAGATVEALAAGIATITGTYKGEESLGIFDGTDAATLEITAASLSVTSDSARVTVQNGSTIGVPISIKNAQGQTVANPTVTASPLAPGNCFTATATATAIVVTGATPGNCTLRISATDPATGATATLDIPVTTTAGPPQTAQLVAPATGVAVGGSLSLIGITPAGEQQQFSAAIRLSPPAAPASLTTGFTSSNTAAATVSASGVVTGVSAGTATITGQWTTNGIDYDATLSVPVGTLSTSTPSSISLSTLTGLSNSVRVGKVTAYRCTAANGSTPVIANTVWTSSNTAVATVNSSGIVTGVAAGSATITCNINSRTTTMPTTVTP